MKKPPILSILFFLLLTGACRGTKETLFSPKPMTSQAAISTAPSEIAAAVFPQAHCNGDICQDTIPNSFWIKNPSSGARMYVQAIHPSNWDEAALETLILVPGGLGIIDLREAHRLADGGFTVIVFDPDGRGRSEGQEDLGGYIHQDGLAAVAHAAGSLPGVDGNRIGLVSYSYGVTIAAGALARDPDLPVLFLIDWEGPADRSDTTLGCVLSASSPWKPCDHDDFWRQREAAASISKIRIPYQRIQSETDHIQPDLSHAVKMINAALDGSSPTVWLNDDLITDKVTKDTLPKLLPGKAYSQINLLITRYANRLFSLRMK